MTPKVSVIIPVYNVENYLRACIESALAQTLKDIEVIILDDGSTDGGPAIIDYYAKQDDRVVTIHKANEGYGKTCNRGFDMARGDYVAILESDDFIEPSMYEDLYRCAIELDADVVKSPYTDCFADGKMRPYPYHRWLSDNMPCNRLYSLRDCSAQLAVHQSIWAGIYKRSYLEKNSIRFEEVPGAGHVDIKFCVESLVHSDRLVWLDTAYYNYRVLREDSSTAAFNISENAERYRQMHDFLKGFPDDFAKVQKSLAAREGVGLYRYYKRTDFSRDDFEILRSLLLDFDDESIEQAPLLTDSEKREMLLCKHDPESGFEYLCGVSQASSTRGGVGQGRMKRAFNSILEGPQGFDWLLKAFAFGVLSIVLLEYVAGIIPIGSGVMMGVAIFFCVWSVVSGLAAAAVLVLKIAKQFKKRIGRRS